MNYSFTRKEDYSSLSSGYFIQHGFGMPCFPVRMNLELFECAKHDLQRERLRVFDPCCGNGFSLTVLGAENRQSIARLFGADIDEVCCGITEENLSLLEKDGFLKRVSEMKRNPALSEEQKRKIEEDAKDWLMKIGQGEIAWNVYRNDILKGTPGDVREIDYVFADVPYGSMTQWQGGEDGLHSPIERMLGNLLPCLSEGGIVTLATDKKVKFSVCEGFVRLDKIRFGHRLVTRLRKNGQ